MRPSGTASHQDASLLSVIVASLLEIIVFISP